MTELRTGQLGAGFFTAQQAQTSRDAVRSEGTGGFMQSLKQTGAAVADMGQTEYKTVTRNDVTDGRSANGAAKAESDGGNAAEGEAVSDTADIRETSSAAGTVKVDEKAVEELNDLKGAVGKTDESDTVTEAKTAEEADGGLNGQQFSDEEAKASLTETETDNTGKSHPEQAREALENAMLKAFKELNDPKKEKEEFEEKLLLFLMKLVDSINGKSDKKSPFDTEEDEDDKKLGGTLMDIIDSMMENAEKNAEMNADRTAAADTAFVGNYLLNTVNMNETEIQEETETEIRIRQPVKPEQPKLYPEIENLSGRGGRVGLNPVVPRAEVQTVGEANGGAAPYSNATENIIVGSGASDMIADVSGANPVHIEETVNLAAGAAVRNIAVTQTDVETAAGSETAQGLPVTEQVAAVIETDSENASYRGGENADFGNSVRTAGTASRAAEGTTVHGGFMNETEPAAEQAAVRGSVEKVPINVPEKTAESGLTNEASLPETSVSHGYENFAPRVSDEASDDLYEQLAVNVYTDVKQAMKSVYTEKGEEIHAASAAAEGTERIGETSSESEFDELARLFGLKKEAEELPAAVREEESEEDSSDGRSADPHSERNKETAAKESIFGADIKITSVKAADAPILRTLPTGGAVNRVITQVVNRILGNIPEKGQENTLVVTLNPETLGKISMKLVENAGKISVTITAENKETAAILASRAESVQESMRDQGTQLEKYQVVYGAEQDGKAEQQNYEGSSKNPYVRDTEEENGDGEFEKILQSEI